MRLRLSIIAIISSILFSSCATILNSQYQKVTIKTGTYDRITVDNQEVHPDEKQQIKLERDHQPKQIRLEKDGYHPQNFVIYPYKTSKWMILSFIPFGTLYLVPPIIDLLSPKTYNYAPINQLNSHWIQNIDTNIFENRELMLNKVALDLDKSNIKYRYFETYKKYLIEKDFKEPEIAMNQNSVKLDQTIFAGILNELLAEHGFIDTNARYLSKSYTNNLFLDATITGATFHRVSHIMTYCELNIEWKLLDIYKQPIFEWSTQTKSGEFVLNRNYRLNGNHYAIKDAMEIALNEVMVKDEIKLMLSKETLLEDPDEMGPIFIDKPENFVATLSDAIESSVTIKNKDGHGSGFIISNDGYIITNYHVVAGVEDMTVVFNNGIEMSDVEVVRVSKSHDLALLKVKLKSMKAFDINDSKEIPIGKDIFAVGTPTSEDLAQTITRGIISAKRKLDNENDLIHSDASINGGNRGRAIIDKKGLVMGVVSSKIRGEGIEGIAFGIPAYEIFEQLKIVYQ